MIITNAAIVRSDQIRYVALDATRQLVLVAFVGIEETLSIKFTTPESAQARYEELSRAMENPCPPLMPTPS